MKSRERLIACRDTAKFLVEKSSRSGIVKGFYEGYPDSDQNSRTQTFYIKFKLLRSQFQLLKALLLEMLR